nr:hypothetical protein [Kozakia baliensis]
MSPLLRSICTGSVALSLTGCGYFDSRAAHRAQMTMVGMTAYDLQACAGIPAKVQKLNDTTQIYQYTGTHTLPTSSDSTIIPVQQIVNMTQVFFGGAGTNCTATIRLDHDRVSEVHYSGDDDEVIGTDGVCSIITRGCARQPEATMQKVNSGPFGPVSAFSSPTTPNQSTSATYDDQSGATVPNLEKNSPEPVIVPRP